MPCSGQFLEALMPNSTRLGGAWRESRLCEHCCCCLFGALWCVCVLLCFFFFFLGSYAMRDCSDFQGSEWELHAELE